MMNKSKIKLPPLVANYLGMGLALLLLIGIFGASTRNFLTLVNFKTIASQIPDITIVAVGMTFALIIAGIDLSVGSVLALCGAVFAMALARWHWPVPAAVCAALGAGLLCGALNGLAIVGWNLPPFIVTLAMLEIARGAAYRLTDSETIYIGSAAGAIAETSLAGVPLPFVIAVAIVIVAQWVLSRSTFGRYLVAIGTNEQAVHLSGIDPRPLKFKVFVLCGLFSAIAAVIQTSRLTALDPNTGYGLELQAIAAVVIGGTSLMGGRGSVISSFFGVLIIAVLAAGLAQRGAGEPTKRIVTGCVICAAVVLDYYRQRLSRRCDQQ